MSCIKDQEESNKEAEEKCMAAIKENLPYLKELARQGSEVIAHVTPDGQVMILKKVEEEPS
jgi:hypothetical protein